MGARCAVRGARCGVRARDREFGAESLEAAACAFSLAPSLDEREINTLAPGDGHGRLQAGLVPPVVVRGEPVATGVRGGEREDARGAGAKFHRHDLRVVTDGHGALHERPCSARF